jgi:hypothetical protein
MLLKKQVQSLHQHWSLPMAVLLEGNFKSMFENRVLAFEQKNLKQGVANKMIVISDGDLIKKSSR